jgi:hypothetical protein
MTENGGSQERRAAFRVSVKPSSGLQASFQWLGKTWPANAGNISADGVFMRPEKSRSLKLDVGTLVTVEIDFHGEHLLLSGEVKSNRGGGYGIFFPTRDQNGYTNPLDQLARISAELQRESLTQRVRVLKDPNA